MTLTANNPASHARLKKLVIVLLMVSLTVSQLGCGCECATVAVGIAIATPIIMLGREMQEMRKAEREMDLLKAQEDALRHGYRVPPVADKSSAQTR